MISANLIGKCLLIGGAGAATGTGIYFIQKSYFSNNEELKALAEKVGLICEGNPTETSGTVCTKKGGASDNIKVKKDTDLNVSAITGGKITVYKTSDKTYNKEFKFVIEDGDISTTDNTKKLEQFETYEIKKEDNADEWKLNRKSEAKAEIKKALGLPEGTECDLPTNTTEKTCTLDATKLKNINFEGKTKEMEVVDGASGATLNLKMKMMTTSDAENKQFPLGYKFELQSNKDINLGGNKSIKKGTNTEFKIKVTPATGGPKVLTLEKAWTVKSLAEKVGLVCPEGDKKECTLKDGSINVNNGDGDSDTGKKFTGLTKKNNADDKKVKYEEDVGDHNQGIKFFVDGEADIELQNGSGGTNDDKKILKKNGTAGNNQISYQILKESSGTTWHLTKKTTTA